MYQQALEKGGLAVVTGAAQGVGFTASMRFAEAGLGVVLVDLPGENLDQATSKIQSVAKENVIVKSVATDISNADEVAALADTVFKTGEVAVLMNNAGIALPSSCLDKADNWRKMMAVNCFGVLNGMQCFLPQMIEANRPAVVINTGSKQGITNPPSNAGYNVSKACVKVMSEMLAHELRESNAPISVHLFIPGFTYTSMISRWIPTKPDSAWTSEQTVDFFIERMRNGDFYILCPDNDVNEEKDKRRVEWASGDIINNRPALSRWHTDYVEEFANYEN